MCEYHSPEKPIDEIRSDVLWIAVVDRSDDDSSEGEDLAHGESRT